MTYDPRLSVVNAISQEREGKLQLLNSSLTLQVGQKNVLRAWRAGVTLVTGSDAGNPLVIHGPTVQQELELWAQAGIRRPVALQAATYNAAPLLRAENRIGSIEPGHEANLLLIDGDPLTEIAATERISLVVYKGE